MQAEGTFAGWTPENLSDAPPQYVEEVEELLRTPFFADEVRGEAVYSNDFAALQPEDIAVRAGVYVQGLRILAKTRAEERREAAVRKNEAAAWNSTWIGSLTVKRVRAIADRNQEAIAGAVYDLHAIEEAGMEIDKREALQEQYVNDTLGTLELPGKLVRSINGDSSEFYKVRGVNVIGPTGVGKTAVMGKIAHRLGIGQPHNAFPERNKTMLIVVPSEHLVLQIAGLIGDQTFIRFSQGIVPTPFYSRQKNLTGPAIVTTGDQYVDNFVDGHFCGVPIDIKVFDESHHLTSPQVEATFLREWRGPTIGFTATPDYNEHKDVGSILPYTVEHINLLESIDDGMTNGAQLFLVLVECPDEELAALTPKEARQYLDRLRLEAQKEFLAPLIAEGRRAMVFCRAGKRGEQAEIMAEMLSEIELPNGENVTAETIYSYNPDSGAKSNAEIIERFHEGKVHALTTVRTALESFNAAIDVEVFGDVYSFLKLRQIIGRGTRLSERFPITIYGQFMVKRLWANRIPYTVYQGFGLERVEQGLILGTPKQKSSAEKDHTVDLSVFPPHLQERMKQVNHKKISELLLRGKHNQIPLEEMPPDYVPFDSIPIPAGMSDSSAKYRLDTAGLTWKGTFVPDRPGLVRYYEPAARTFFIDHKMPAKGSPDLHISVNSLAGTYNVGYATMLQIIEEECGIPTIELKVRGNRPGQHIRRASLAKLDKHMEEERPIKQPGDISAEDLAAEMGITYGALWGLSDRKNIRTKPRRNPQTEQTLDTPQVEELSEGTRTYSKAEADILRDLVKAYPRADETDKLKSWVMEQTGMSDMKRFTKNFTEEEKAWLTSKWIHDRGGKLVLNGVWTEEESVRIVRRFKEELTHELPPYLLPSVAVTRFLDIDSKSLLQKLRVGAAYRGQSQKIRLGIATTAHYVCLPWHLVKQLQAEGYGRLMPMGIKYDKLPAGPEDTDPERIAYARSVQAKLTPPTLLGFDPSPYLQ